VVGRGAKKILTVKNKLVTKICRRPPRGGWTILKWILERYDGMVWMGLIWLRTGMSGGLL
jgi:hypothetical protein